MDIKNWILFTISGVAILGVIFLAAIADQKEIDRLKMNCRVVAQIDSSVNYGYGLSTNGKLGMVTTFESAKTGYLCPDGVVYYH